MIEHVSHSKKMFKMYELAIFAGGGGGILAGHLLGWTCIGAVEIEEYQRAILLQRQNDGLLPPFPVWDDVRTFRSDNPECALYFDILRQHRRNLVISGGFPCQDISVAGKGAGLSGARSGLVWEYVRILREVLPAIAYMENSPALTNRGLGTLLGALSEMGYNACWGVLGASDVGANHRRKRIWIVAYANQDDDRRQNERGIIYSKAGAIKNKAQRPDRERVRAGFGDGSKNVPNTNKAMRERRPIAAKGVRQRSAINDQNVSYAHKERCKTERKRFPVAGCAGGARQKLRGAAIRRSWWESEPAVGRVVDGLAGRVVQLETLGNGQVPAVAAAAFTLLQSIIPKA